MTHVHANLHHNLTPFISIYRPQYTDKLRCFRIFINRIFKVFINEVSSLLLEFLSIAPKEGLFSKRKDRAIMQSIYAHIFQFI